jgi:hypothetical protein
MIRSKVLDTGVAAGGAGVATATGKSNGAIEGRVLAVGIVYLDSPPATTDIVLRTSGTSGPTRTILTIANAAANGWWFPRHLDHDEAGVALTTRSPLSVNDQLEAVIAQANNGDSALVTVIYDDAD